MSIYADAFKQCYFIPQPTLTEKNLPDQSGRVLLNSRDCYFHMSVKDAKLQDEEEAPIITNRCLLSLKGLRQACLHPLSQQVCIVTGGYAGCGKELSKILYGKNATVYVAGRSDEKAKNAIEEIKKAVPSSDGRLEFLKVDLSDLTTIKASADDFTRREQRLDVLTNNAGVMNVPVGSKGAQGHELQMVTNCLGPYLFTQLLTPIIQKTAASSRPGSVRVTWAASLGTMMSPKPGGVIMDQTTGGAKIHGNPAADYMQSKSGNVFLARAYQAEHQNDNIISNSWNPGNLASELARHTPWWQMIFIKAMLYPAIFGAYTELFGGWADEAGKEDKKGAYIGPWGRFVMLRPDVDGNEEGQQKFWGWCEHETKAYR